MKVGSTSRRPDQRLWLFIIVLIALALRIGLASLPRVVRWDEPDYLWLGKSLLTGHGYTITGVPELHYPPLFPVLAGGVYWLTGQPELGSAFWYVVLGALLVLPVFALAKRIYGTQVAWFSAILVAVFPGLSSTVLYWGTMTEPLFILIVYSALWTALVALEDGKLWAYAATGALLSLAYLSRPEGIVWLASLGVLFLVMWIAKRQLFRWRTPLNLLVFLASFLILAAPYIVFLHEHTGKWLATGKLSITYDIGEAVLERDPVLYDQVTASLDSASGEILWWSNKRFERSMLDIILEDPQKFVSRIWRNMQRMRSAIFSPTIFPLFLLAPVALAWFRQPWGRRRLGHEALLWAGVLPVAAFLPFHVEVRFFSPAFPAMLIWLAAGLWALGGWAAETLTFWRSKDGTQAPASVGKIVRDQSIVAGLCLAVLMIYMVRVHFSVVQNGMKDLSFAHKTAGLWLKENSPPDAAIMSRDLAVSLYAERGFVVSPRTDYANYLAYARRKGASYLLVDENELRVLRPHLAFLLDDANPPPELERVFSARDRRGLTIVYRIKD